MPNNQSSLYAEVRSKKLRELQKIADELNSMPEELKDGSAFLVDPYTDQVVWHDPDDQKLNQIGDKEN